MQEDKRDELIKLYREFATDYLPTPDGQAFAQSYGRAREQAEHNYREIIEAEKQGQDVTELVLLRLLPYEDSPEFREKEAWVGVQPSVTWNAKFSHTVMPLQAAPDRKPGAARATLRFVRQCVEHPSDFPAALAEFKNDPDPYGFGPAVLSPILNALRPNEYIVANQKTLKTINYFLDTNYPSTLNFRHLISMTRGAQKIIQELAEAGVGTSDPGLRAGDLFDMLCHWLVEIKRYFVGYWKIAPGENAWNWDACREGGYITVGWEEIGDLTNVQRSELDNRVEELEHQHPGESGWTKAGLAQLWAFAHNVKIGDRIVANQGTSKVLGIGTVTGPYYFVSGVRHGHRLPVRWDDTRPRDVTKPGWRRTLIKLNQQEFEEIVRPTPPPPPPIESYFAPQTFDLLAQLHDNPTKALYMEHRAEFEQYVEGAFRQFFKDVIAKLPQPILDAMETEKGIFSRILKNDYGRGGAWPWYWGALYPKGSKRSEDVQLFAGLSRTGLGIHFMLGDYSRVPPGRFQRNVRFHNVRLRKALQDLSDQKWVWGSSGAPSASLDEWLNQDHPYPRAGTEWSPQRVLSCPKDELVEYVVDAFAAIYPIALCAMLDEPTNALQRYLGDDDPDGGEVNPEYPLPALAAHTGYTVGELQTWIDALDRKKQAILYGPPGTGKTYLAEHLARHLIGGGDGFMELVQFHPAYAYEDFIQGLRPQRTAEGELTYEMVPGRFKEFCDKARACTGTCVLIIDEINRANLARVFGELMYLLEYRGASVPLAGGGAFSIPANVRILGTMNTADRSIALVDHALRRRFAFIALQPNMNVLRIYHKGKTLGYNLDALIGELERLNEAITDSHYAVGITFFLKAENLAALESIWRMEIEPYLEEYFYGARNGKLDQFRWAKIADRVRSSHVGLG